MRALSQKEKARLNKTLLVLLDELEEECLKVIKLTEGLRIETLTNDQMEDMLSELSASVTHLKVHSEQVERIIEEELDKI
ncbi:MAG: hypothetical protein QMC83_00945 [Thermodesulfovibrionales bacterium]|nr:hypothetical protein [Thermodesulfovibrionales bacterium]